MSFRSTLKNIVSFSKREFREKKPYELEIRKVKDKTLFTRGFLPLLKFNKIEETHYIIVADYGSSVRIYSFSKEGLLLGGENVEKSPSLTKRIISSSVLQYRLPKKEIKKVKKTK